MENMSIGLVGVGTMGSLIATSLLEAGHNVVACDVEPHAVRRAREAGASVVERPQQVAERTDIILLVLPGPSQVDIAVTGESGLLAGARPGPVIVDMSTVDPATTRRMGNRAQEVGVDYLDAPILGRPGAFGSWVLPVGGDAAIVARCRPVLEVVARKVIHVGPLGAGHTLKLLNALMFSAINAMTAEMMAVASRIGIEPKLLYDTITSSQAGTVSNLFKELGGRIASGNYDDPTFTVDLLIKDIRLGVKMAKEGGAPPILGRTVELINEIAQTQGLGSSDTSATWQSYLRLWGEGWRCPR